MKEVVEIAKLHFFREINFNAIVYNNFREINFFSVVAQRITL